MLRVNLTNSTITVEELPGGLTDQFLGGRGLATKVLYDEVDAQVEPLSPENKIIFMTGYDDPDIRKSAMEISPVAYMIKPVNASAIHEIIVKINK